jgi:hypothetical protein
MEVKFRGQLTYCCLELRMLSPDKKADNSRGVSKS